MIINIFLCIPVFVTVHLRLFAGSQSSNLLHAIIPPVTAAKSLYTFSSLFLLKVVLDIQEVLYLLTVVLASVTPVLGILLLNALFGNKIKELFSDTKFFIFFFLIFGYSLYAMGEVTWFLTFKIFDRTPTTGMQDAYWVTGMIIMFISLLALNRTLHREHGQEHKFSLRLMGGMALIVLAGLYLLVLGTEGFFGYFYVLGGAVLVVSSYPLVLFFKSLPPVEKNLVYLFYSNVCFLLAGILWVYITPREIHVFLEILYLILYCGAYVLTVFAFSTLLIKFYLHSSGKSLQ